MMLNSKALLRTCNQQNRVRLTEFWSLVFVRSCLLFGQRETGSRRRNQEGFLQAESRAEGFSCVASVGEGSTSTRRAQK
jgi:hypothetical protein